MFILSSCLKNAFEVIYSWGCSLPLRVFYFHSETPLEKTKWSFSSDYQLEIAYSLERKECVYFFFSFISPSGPDLPRPYTCCLSTCELICWFLRLSFGNVQSTSLYQNTSLYKWRLLVVTSSTSACSVGCVGVVSMNKAFLWVGGKQPIAPARELFFGGFHWHPFGQQQTYM